MNEKTQLDCMTKKCPQCGLNLPPGMLEGLCPACLLQQATTETAAQPALPPFEPPPLEEVQRLFPSLEILSFLGKGGMGAVYKARQPALDRIVALKLLPSRQGGDPSFKDRFTREARALAKLSHPSIVAVHEFGEVQNHRYFIMEYVDGVNLRQLQKTKRLSPREALQIIPQICDALQYAHDQGVVHRDIKPENLMVDRKGRIIITDFGLAKMLDLSIQDFRLTGEGQVMGTPHYMAPEQLEQPWSVDHRADIYSLGVVLYEMLTGELPLGKFQSPSKKIQIDVRLDEIVLHALEKEPDRRYQHASQVGKDLETISSASHPMQPLAETNRPPNSEPAGPTAEETEKMKVIRKKTGFISTALLAVGISGLLFFNTPHFCDWQLRNELASFWMARFDLWNFLMLLTVVGAVRYNQLRNHPLALGGAVSALITTATTPLFFVNSTSFPAWLIWSVAFVTVLAALKCLLQRDVREAFKTGDDVFYSSPSKWKSKWSLFALFGAGSVLVGMGFRLVEIIRNLFGFQNQPALWQQGDGNLLLLCFMGGLWAILTANAIFGWLGWEEIRRSHGKMRGMGFAFAALLFFPVSQLSLWFKTETTTDSDFNGLLFCSLLGFLFFVLPLSWWIHRRENLFLLKAQSSPATVWWPMRMQVLWIPRLAIIAVLTLNTYSHTVARPNYANLRTTEDLNRLRNLKHPLPANTENPLDYRGQTYAVAIKSVTTFDSTNELFWLPDGRVIRGAADLNSRGHSLDPASRRIMLTLSVPATESATDRFLIDIRSGGVLLTSDLLLAVPVREVLNLKSTIQCENVPAESPDRKLIFLLSKVPITKQTVDLTIGMSAGNWEDTAMWDFQGGLPRHPQRTFRRFGQQVEIAPSLYSGGPSGIGVSWRLSTKKRLWIEKMVGIDKNGTIYDDQPYGSYFSGSGRGSFFSRGCYLNGCKISDIKELRYWIQKVRYVHFNNISVIPGVRSQPEMVIDEKSAMD
jgi:serine/threonine protein kinase